MAFPDQFAGVLLLLSTTLTFGYLSKDSALTSGVIKWNMLNFMSIVYKIVF